MLTLNENIMELMTLNEVIPPNIIHKLEGYRLSIERLIKLALASKSFPEFSAYTDQVMPKFILIWTELVEYSTSDPEIKSYRATRKKGTLFNNERMEKYFKGSNAVYKRLLNQLESLPVERQICIPVKAKDDIRSIYVNNFRVLFVCFCAQVSKNHTMKDFLMLHLRQLTQKNKRMFRQLMNEWPIITDPVTVAAIKTHAEYASRGERAPGTKSIEDVFKELGVGVED